MLIESITTNFNEKESIFLIKSLYLEPYHLISKCDEFAWVIIQWCFFDIVFIFDKYESLNDCCMPWHLF